MQQPSELEVLLRSREPAAILDAILGSTPSGALIARAPDGKIVRVSDSAVRLLGWARSDLEGLPMRKVLDRVPLYATSGESLPEKECPLFRALQGESVSGFELNAQSASGELIPCLSSAAPIPELARGADRGHQLDRRPEALQGPAEGPTRGVPGAGSPGEEPSSAHDRPGRAEAEDPSCRPRIGRRIKGQLQDAGGGVQGHGPGRVERAHRGPHFRGRSLPALCLRQGERGGRGCALTT